MWLDLLANQSPLDFLHDPFWQFVINLVAAIGIGLIGVLVTIYIFRKQLTRRILTYEIVSDAPLVSVNKVLEDRVTIQLDGKPVQNARLLTIRVLNAGNVAIKGDDYADPIRFAFPGSTIIGSDIIATDPPDLSYSIDKTTFVKLSTDRAQLGKFLLNPREAVKFTVFLTGASDQFNVRGRIVDGRVEKATLAKHPFIVQAYDSLGFAVLIVVAVILLALTGILTGEAVAILFGGLLGYIFGIVTPIARSFRKPEDKSPGTGG